MGILLIFTALFSSLNCKVNVDLFLPINSKAVLVDKEQGLLRLIEKKGDSYVVTKEYFMSYAQANGTKDKKGDNKTPEGIYFIEKVIPREDLPDEKYGALAAPLNYPNPIDKSLKRTGDGIWIHGTNDVQRMSDKNVTNGCIILKNPDLMELVKDLRPMRTPIVIVDAFNDVKFTNSDVRTVYAEARGDKWKYKVTAELEKSPNVLYERF